MRYEPSGEVLAWEGDAFTRAEIVRGYTRVEKARARRAEVGRFTVTETPLPDGRVEVRIYEHGTLVEVRRKMPGGAAPVAHVASRGEPVAARLA
jgi:hypothetical protein